MNLESFSMCCIDFRKYNFLYKTLDFSCLNIRIVAYLRDVDEKVVPKPTCSPSLNPSHCQRSSGGLTAVFGSEALSICCHLISGSLINV